MSATQSPVDPYVQITEDLTYTYDGVFSPETVAGVVAEARALLEVLT